LRLTGKQISKIMKKRIITTFVGWGLIISSGIGQTIDTLVDVGGHRLYFHIIEGEGMPILFESGAGADVEVWDTLLNPVAEITHATLITYDRAGFGKSELDTSNHDVDKHGIVEGSKSLETALKKLGYEGNLVIVAHSYGGFCATLYASRHPKTVKAAVLIDANHVNWFLDRYVDSVMTLRKNYWTNNPPTTNWADYYAGLNLARTIDIMRKSPFPANIPVIDLVSEINFPDSAMAARWKACHAQFAATAPNRQAITAYGCGHFIFRDNLMLTVAAIVKAYAGTQHGDRQKKILASFLSYSLERANQEKRKDHP
jgi:pimeloyl-ACP methyl ester carboxylesterase